MLAERNKRFRIAALLVSASYLILAGRYFIDTVHTFEPGVAGGYVVGVVLFTVGRVLGAAGWGVVATAFGREIGWRRLRIGGAMVALVVVIDLAGSIFYLLPILAHVHNADYRATYRWDTAGALLIAAGACTVVTGLADSRRGSSRAHRLWVGSMFITAGYGAGTVSALFLQSFYSSEHAVPEATIGGLVGAVGAFGLALAGVVFLLAVRRSLVRRESALFAAALIAAVAFVCIVVGDVLIVFAYGAHGGEGWQVSAAVFQAGADAALIASLVALASGARTVAAPTPLPA